MRIHAAAFGAAAGALLAVPVPIVVVIAVVAVAGFRRSGLAVAVAGCVLVSLLAHRALAGLDPPEPGSFDAWVTLVDDPRPSGPGVAVRVRHERRLLVATAHAGPAGRLDDLRAGERVRLSGSVRPVGRADHWWRWRHVVGRVAVESVGPSRSGSPLVRAANGLRATLASGAAALSDDDRALFLGMVIGDDRDQSVVTADDFRAAGLGHLLVVSGQNVAFVLALASPLATRLRPGPRLLALVALLALFALITRFEPSVLRAVAMAGIGVAGPALGFPVDGRRALAGAVAGLLVVDPFLVHVVAFRLSVAATAGIVWLAEPLAGRMRGPRPLALALATTASAQLAVAPVLVATFGPVPLASLPANLLAGPASGPVMMWGATAGLVAGVFGGTVATAVHLPTRTLLWWVRSVASAAAVAPPAMVAGGALVVLAVAVALVLRGERLLRHCGTVLVAMVVITSLAEAPSPGSGHTVLGRGIHVYRSGTAVVLELDDPARPRDVLATVRRAGVGRPDLVVASDGDAADAGAVMALVDRHGPLPVLAPPLHRVPGARTAQVGQEVRLGSEVVVVTAVEPSLEVAFRPVSEGVTAAPGAG